jgi:hypothetical protein
VFLRSRLLILANLRFFRKTAGVDTIRLLIFTFDSPISWTNQDLFSSLICFLFVVILPSFPSWGDLGVLRRWLMPHFLHSNGNRKKSAIVGLMKNLHQQSPNTSRAFSTAIRYRQVEIRRRKVSTLAVFPRKEVR